ncbi:MAG: AsmA family protein, partial [Bryobacteraceae bacterium]
MRKWLLIVGCVLVIFGIAAGIFIKVRLGPMLKGRVEKLMADRFSSGVVIDHLEFTLFPAGVTVTGMTLRHHHRTDVPPLITIRRVTAQTDLLALIFGANRAVKLVRLEGLQIRMKSGGSPNKQSDEKPSDQSPGGGGGRFPFVIREVIADGTLLQILPKQEGKQPLDFDIQKLTLRSVGVNQPMAFVATLTNAKPPGAIQTNGSFGPWQKDAPSTTPVSGQYTFNNADLGVFKGIAGTLSSVGDYKGELDRIEVKGTTDTPNFTVGSGHVVDLKTGFEATVDGTNGNTLLHPVDARFLNSEFVCKGGVVGTPGKKGKAVQLDVVSKQAQIEDLLTLVLSSPKPLLKGPVSFKTKFLLPQGDSPVLNKLLLDGRFDLVSAQFTSDKVQDKIDALSNRSRGIHKGQNEADNVASNLRAQFVLKNGNIRFSRLSFQVPGALISLTGAYGLRSEKIDFKGHARFKADLS